MVNGVEAIAAVQAGREVSRRRGPARDPNQAARDVVFAKRMLAMELGDRYTTLQARDLMLLSDKALKNGNVWAASRYAQKAASLLDSSSPTERDAEVEEEETPTARQMEEEGGAERVGGFPPIGMDERGEGPLFESEGIRVFYQDTTSDGMRDGYIITLKLAPEFSHEVHPSTDGVNTYFFVMSLAQESRTTGLSVDLSL